jgi:hypothetical protein
MEVIRVIKNKNYTTISNQLFKNKTISLKAKGLMAYLLSLPNDWNLSINGIVACSKEGRRAIGNTIKELISAGYIERNQVREKGKFVGYDYFVFEQPKCCFAETDKSFTDNSIQISKEVTKEIINKNISIKEKFISEVNSFEYKDCLKEEFIDYWCEGKKRMRWQKQPTFDISLRLKRWKKNQKNWNGSKKATMSKIDMHLQSQKKAEELLKKYHNDKGTK